MSQMLTLPYTNAVSIGSLEAYMAELNAMPILTQQEEYQLAMQFKEQGDLQAAQHLTVSNLRYVVRIARGYMGYGLPLNDLISEGAIGLMKAVKRFDPYLNVRLIAFAVHWIKSEIHEYVIKNWRIVKVATTKAQRKLFFNLRSFKKQLTWFTPGEAKEVATELNVPIQDVYEMEQRLQSHDLFFESHTDESNSEHFAPESYIGDDTDEPTKRLIHIEQDLRLGEHLGSLLERLDERSRTIVKARWMTEPKATLFELSETLGISMERVRQIEAQAFKKLREALGNIQN